MNKVLLLIKIFTITLLQKYPVMCGLCNCTKSFTK